MKGEENELMYNRWLRLVAPLSRAIDPPLALFVGHRFSFPQRNLTTTQEQRSNSLDRSHRSRTHYRPRESQSQNMDSV